MLCGVASKSIEHIFFDCAFSSEVWLTFFRHSRLTPPSTLAMVFQWVLSPPRNARLNSICKLIFQAVMYFLSEGKKFKTSQLCLQASPCNCKGHSIAYSGKVVRSWSRPAPSSYSLYLSFITISCELSFHMVSLHTTVTFHSIWVLIASHMFLVIYILLINLSLYIYVLWSVEILSNDVPKRKKREKTKKTSSICPENKTICPIY